MTKFYTAGDFESHQAAISAGWNGDGWYFWDETQANCYGPYGTKLIAEIKERTYFLLLNGVLPRNAFVLVKSTHPTHAKKDAMVMDDFKDGTVGLIFGFDRYNRGQNVICVGVELWDKSDLDLTTVCF